MARRVTTPGIHSIRTRLLVVFLGLTIVSVVVTAYLGINALLAAGTRVQRISGVTLRAQSLEYVHQLAISEAQRNDLILGQIQHDVENVASYAAAVFDNPAAFSLGGVWRAEDHMSLGPDGEYANDQSDTSSVFVPNFARVDDHLRSVLETSSYLDLIFPSVFEHNANTVAIYLGAKEEITWYYPNVHLGAILPPDFQVTSRPWYVAAALGNDSRQTIWTPVYEDATGQGLMVTAAAPVYTSRGDFVGVIGVDMTLQDISESIESMRLLGGGYSFLVDDKGRAVALPEQASRDILGQSPGPSVLGIELADAATSFRPILGDMISGLSGSTTVQVGDRELFVGYAPLTTTGWSLASVAESQDVLRSLGAVQDDLAIATRSLLFTRIVPIGLVILVVTAASGWILTHRLVRPIRELAAAAERIGSGQWDQPLPEAGGDEVGLLTKAFAAMTADLRRLLAELQQRVDQRTRGLQAAAEVSRSTTLLLDIDQLLPHVVETVRERFDLYYVGLFLLDEDGKFAVLRAGTGEFGRQMLARGHRLEVGGESMIGQCVSRNELRVALDAGAEAVRFDNPLLPETRSELALPLRARGRTVGAMTVQSVERYAFDSAYVAILQTMADQVAIAIDNARLFSDSQAALAEIEAIQRRYVTQAWADYLKTARVTGYEARRPDMAPLGDVIAAEVGRAMSDRRTVVLEEDGRAALVVPIQSQGQMVGALGVHADGARRWTEEEINLVETIAERMIMIADSLRLLDQAQRREARERLTLRITDQIRAAVDIEEILSMAVKALGRETGATEVVVRLGTKDRF